MPRIEGIAAAPFTIYHGGDGDGPVEWCRPVPDEHADEHADELAERFPDLTLRTEAARQEAWISAA